MLPDLFNRLKPVLGRTADRLWIEYQIADLERKREIEEYLTLLAVKHLGIALGDERLALEPPPDLPGEYTLGATDYPGLAPHPVRVRRNDLMRHTFLLGPTGTGKSTFILGLLQQLLTTGVPFMVFDFKRNYRCLLTHPDGKDLLVLTVGRDTAALALNAMTPPEGVSVEEWCEALSDSISTSYLLMQGARNVLKEALLRATREKKEHATLRDAHALLNVELRSSRAGSRRYGWLESSTRALEELTKGGFGRALGATSGISYRDLLSAPVVFELEGLGDDQKSFFCLLLLQAVLLTRKHQTLQREVLHHVLVFDESHNVFPRERPGELSIPSRLAREVREYGEAIIAATQQADVSESLIANSGIKIILRIDYPKDVQFAANLMQLDQRWFPKLRLGTAIVRLPTRFYTPFLITFPQQSIKNAFVPDETVRRRFAAHALGEIRAGANEHERDASGAADLSEKERALVMDVNTHPISTVTERYERLGWNPKTGNTIKDAVIDAGMARFDEVPTPTGRIKILTLTKEGDAYAEQHGGTLVRARRGGAAHEYWRHRVRQALERDGYTVTEEFPLGGGTTVDLRATKGDEVVLVEIETGRSDIPANVAKCCAAKPSRFIMFFTDPALADLYTPLLRFDGVMPLTPATLDELRTVRG